MFMIVTSMLFAWFCGTVALCAPDCIHKRSGGVSCPAPTNILKGSSKNDSKRLKTPAA